MLSNYYFCVARNNISANNNAVHYVVNCFQIIIFVSPETTFHRTWTYKRSCELLSNYYFCVARNNKHRVNEETLLVVNCFQIIIFVSPETTMHDANINYVGLWIAFKLLFLCRQKQLPTPRRCLKQGCELLSNYYFCVARNNTAGKIFKQDFVVNCFQIIIFVSPETTYKPN